MFGPAEANNKDHEREVKRLHAKIGELTMIADPARRLAMNAAEYRSVGALC